MKRVILKRYDAERFLPMLQRVNGLEVVALTDRKAEEKELPDLGIEVLTTLKAKGLYQSGAAQEFYLPGTVKLSTIKNMEQELLSCGVKRRDIRILWPDFLNDPSEQNICSIDDYSRIPYMEFHVADHCNLNCRGCVHFSPLVKGEVFADYQLVEKDFRQLKSKVRQIDTIRILGGEPLLNAELPMYIRLVRDLYPDTRLGVVTNGLLLGKLSEQVILAMKETSCEIDVSLYPPVMEQMDRIASSLREQGIQVNVSLPVDRFSYALDNRSGHAAFANRQYCSCPNLYEGKLYVCPIIAYAKYYNDYFDEDLKIVDGAIDLYDESLSFEDIEERLHRIYALCDRCLYVSREHARERNWEQTKIPRQSDYVWGLT